MLISEVEQRPTLNTTGYDRHRRQRFRKEQKLSKSMLFNWASSTCEQCSASKWNRPFINQQWCGLVSVHWPLSSPQQGRKVCCTADCDADRWLHRVFLHWAVSFERTRHSTCQKTKHGEKRCIRLFFLCGMGEVRSGRGEGWDGVTAYPSNNYRTSLLSEPECSAGVGTTKTSGVSV